MTDTQTAPPATKAGARPPKSRRANVNWHSHPPAWTVPNIALAVFTAAWIGHKLALSPMLALAAGALGLFGAAAAAMIDSRSGAVIAWRAICWAVPTAWACAALAWSPWHPAVAVSGIVLALALGILAGAVRKARRAARAVTKPESHDSAQVARAPADEVWNAADPGKTKVEELAENWTARIRRVCRIKGAQVIAVAMWTEGTGYTLKVQLPLGGASWKDIRDHAEPLAEDARLAPDCGITVKPSAERRGLAEVQVSHVNKMRETHTVEADYSPQSIYQPIRLFTLPDGAIFRVALKWAWMSITGQTGSGKSSLLHLLTLQLGRCTDAIIWHIDVGGGGGISRPWVAPWHEGRAARPVVDWAATTDAEADLMCRAAIKIIEGRKKHYARQLDNGKVVCSPEVPHIVIVSDETATLPERVKGLLVRISQTGRAAGVRGATSALRATAGDLPRDIKQHSRVKVAMRVDDPDEIRYMFDGAGKVDPELAPWEGSGWVERQDEDADGKPVGKKHLTPAKADFMPDSMIDEAAVAIADLRPKLDAASVALANSVTAGGRAYTDRWDRCLPELFVTDGEEIEEPGDPDRARRIAEAEARQQAEYENMGSVEEGMEKLSALKDKILATDYSQESGRVEVDPEAVAELTGELTDSLSAVLAVVDQAGPDGIGPAEILRRVNAGRAEADHITIKTVQRKLGELVDGGMVTNPQRGVYVSAIHQEGQQ